MSVHIVSLNYSAHVWSPASWGDLDGFQGLLGVGAPSRHPALHGPSGLGRRWSRVQRSPRKTQQSAGALDVRSEMPIPPFGGFWWLFRQTSFGVFELPMQRNVQKRNKTN
jgi:hypothetical protein